MKIIQKKCPSCNGNLDLENGQTEGKCPYCGTDFIIDDDTIEVKYSGTIEVKDDYDLEIAMTTLDKFKEYDKARYMFRNLVSRYGHKEEIYIYLVRAITYDFNREVYTLIDIKEMNTNFNKYEKLAKSKDVNKYKDKVKSINSKFWLDRVITLSDNFNADGKNLKLSEIKSSWDSLKEYSDEETVNKYKDKFNDFYVTALDNRKKNRKRKLLISGVIALIAIIALIIFVVLQLTEKPKVKVNEIKYSSYLNGLKSYNIGIYMLENYFSNVDNIKDTEVEFNKSNKKLYIKLTLKNLLKTEEFKFTLDVVDDLGPVFDTNTCEFTDVVDVDLFSCIKASDLTDGDIDKDNITLDTSDCDLEQPGSCTVIASAKDKDGYETSANISVDIKETKLNVKVSTKNESIRVGESTKLNYSIEPNVKNKKVTLEYDNKIVSIDKNNNIKGLKKGTTVICVIPEYNKDERTCITFNVKMSCKSSYTFKYDGSKKEKIVVEEDICPGTYKFSASVLNKGDHYSISYVPADGMGRKYYSIWKSTPYLNDEGSKIAFEAGSYLEVDAGITKITLTK